MKILKRLVIILPIICGIAMLIIMKANKKRPEQVENRERVQAVRVITLEKMDVVPRITGYGYVGPDRVWQAIPEVSGQVVHINENLKKGSFIRQGELLLRIDTTAYGLAESKGVAEVMNLDARLKELEQSRENTQKLLGIEKKALAIAAQELSRKRRLFEQQYISASDMEKEETDYLARQTMVNNLENTLNLIPAQKKALLAQRKSGESAVAERRLDVAKTEIRAPFNGRLSAVDIERHQFAPAGSVLLEAESIDRVEIPVQLTPAAFFKLLPGLKSDLVKTLPDIETIRRAIGIKARVTLPSIKGLDGSLPMEWEGRFSRTGESLDPSTGTLTFYVTVDAPYENIIPGKRPPLATNMYVAVELTGRALENRVAVPRSAVHGDRIYICTRDNRLEIRKISRQLSLSGIVVLGEGVEPGERLVLSDLVPAIEGMRLLPVIDEERAVQLRHTAAGSAPGLAPARKSGSRSNQVSGKGPGEAD